MRDETAQLRAGLEGRGAEWEDMSIPDINVSVTLWYSEYGPCTAIEGSNDVPNGTLGVSANLTAEQAIDATLGPRTCRNDAKPMAQQENDRLKAENAKLREQMERLVTLLRNDCDIEASWDGLRRFWSIELTEDGCLMRDRVCKAEAENAKLRELLQDYHRYEHEDCHSCRYVNECRADESGRCIAPVRLGERYRELGVEP